MGPRAIVVGRNGGHAQQIVCIPLHSSLQKVLYIRVYICNASVNVSSHWCDALNVFVWEFAVALGRTL